MEWEKTEEMGTLDVESYLMSSQEFIHALLFLLSSSCILLLLSAAVRADINHVHDRILSSGLVSGRRCVCASSSGNDSGCFPAVTQTILLHVTVGSFPGTGLCVLLTVCARDFGQS